MATELRFDGRVVIVTGAGNGLGRAHALLFASRGARVVVNDLGGGMHGGGQNSAAADAVVAEIKAAGGDAVASHDSVEHGDRIVQTALDAFGRIDVVVNNAGILRDVSFQKMTQEDWELIQRVHMLGAFRVTHAAWPHMRDQGYGRIIMTSSAAGIYGNFGQANYAAAKLGLVGFASTLAVEGGRKGVHVNTIAPIAGSRLTETVLPKELTDALRPEYVSPLVLWLCHEDCQENGGLFEVGGGFFSKLRWERSRGATMRLGRAITPEWIKGRWSEIAGFEHATHPASIAESMAPIMDNVQAGPSKGGNELIDVDLALGYEMPPQTTSYDERDLVLYALGVGAGKNPLDESELRLVYEQHPKGFLALPTFGVIPALRCIIDMVKEGKSAPGLSYGLDRILHGEQYLELTRPLPTRARLEHRARIKEIWDKGKGAIVNTEIRSYDENGELLIVNELIMFVRGAGGWGGDPGPSGDINTPPDRAPDRVIEDTIAEDQALLYRLSGDINPLHVDPSFARAFGFERPILHGLCTFGYAARHVVSAFAGGDPRYFKSIKVRFARSVFPGETVVTEMWKESDTRVVFRCKVKERDEAVITHAAIELYQEIPKPKAAPKAAPKAGAAAEPAGPTSADVFLGIKAYVAEHPELVEKVQTVFVFKLSDPDSAWTLDLKSGDVAPGVAASADCTLDISEADFLAMSSGKADPQKLYFGGKLKISGNIMASQKLSFLQKIDPAWAAKKVAELKAQGAAMVAAPAAQAEPYTPVAPPLREALARRLADTPALADQLHAIIEIRVTAPEHTFTVRALPGDLGVAEGHAAEPDAVITITDPDLAALARQEITARELYQRGRMRVDGDVSVAHRLGVLNNLI